MRGLPALAASASQRTRRWDAVVLGGALPGLIAAVRLGMRGERVLVLEEDAALAAFPGLREPFLMTGGDGGGVLAACLRALGVPLIDRRRLDPDACAYQIVCGRAPRHRRPVSTIKSSSPGRSRRPNGSRAGARARRRGGCGARRCCSRGRRSTRRLPLGSAGRPRAAAARRHPPPARAPAAVASAPVGLAALFAAQVRALSNLGRARPPGAPRASAGLALEHRLLAPGRRAARAARRIESCMESSGP
jgi:hypothetical protein